MASKGEAPQRWANRPVAYDSLIIGTVSWQDVDPDTGRMYTEYRSFRYILPAGYFPNQIMPSLESEGRLLARGESTHGDWTTTLNVAQMSTFSVGLDAIINRP